MVDEIAGQKKVSMKRKIHNSIFSVFILKILERSWHFGMRFEFLFLVSKGYNRR